jgi:hypothetical protein
MTFCTAIEGRYLFNLLKVICFITTVRTALSLIDLFNFDN